MKSNIIWKLSKYKPVRPYNQKYLDYKFLNDNTFFKHNFYVPFILIIFLLKKCGIKFYRYPDQFGHQNFDIEYFLREEISDFGIHIFILGVSVPNDFLYSKHKKLLNIVRLPKWLLKKIFAIDKFSKIKFGKSIFNGSEYVYKKIDIVKKDWDKQSSKIIFTKKELEMGEDLLKNLGLEKYNFVTFASRNNNYYLKNNKDLFEFFNKKDNKITITEHENELAQIYRNSDFLKYKSSIQFLNDQGYKSVRVGAGENEVSLNDSFFVDFAGKFRNELGYKGHFLDIFLLHFSKFFVGGGTGINASIVTTPVPALAVNAFPWPWLCVPPRKIDMYVPKIYTNDDKDLIHFRDLLELSTLIDWRTFYDGGLFFSENKNLKVIDNTSAEILEAVKEMFFRIQNNFETRIDDTYIGREFNKIIKPEHEIHAIKSQISLSFIKKYKNLIL